MSDLDYREHPFALVHEIFSTQRRNWTLHFSKYLYRPQSVFDQREVVEVTASDLSVAWIEDQICSLRPEWELAMNSKVVDSRGRTLHIGMIDFVGKPDISLVAERIRQMLGPPAAARMQYFYSGRSIHGYLAHFMKPGEWNEYLGRLLLMNAVGEEPLVDVRWVGHRLLGGYAALRWSANSSHHFRLPVRVR